MRDAYIGEQAVEIANKIVSLLDGRNTAACYLALSIVLGRTASLGQRPDFDGMMRLVEKTARYEFEKARKE